MQVPSSSPVELHRDPGKPLKHKIRDTVLTSPQYFIGTQLVSFILIAPWLSTSHTYDSVFEGQPRLVNKSWYAFHTLLHSVLELLTRRLST